MIYILVCKHVRDSAWGVEPGEGGGGGGGGGRPLQAYAGSGAGECISL